MANMVPFNRRNLGLAPMGFDGFRNMLDDFFSENWAPQRSLVRDTFKIDIQDADDSYIIEADMPGVERENIKLETTEGNLIISVTREDSSEENKKNYIHKERRFASMSRNIYLGDINQDAIEAKLDNGVLNIKVPKQKNTSKTKKVDIK